MDLSTVDALDDEGCCDLDSHADTCVAGANTVKFEEVGQVVRVSPFSGSYKPIEDIPVVTALTAWTNPGMGMMIIFVLNESLFFGTS